MLYWRYFLAAGFLMAALNVGGIQRWACIGGAVLSIIWQIWYGRHLKRKRAEFAAKHPAFDPNYEFIVCQAEHTELSDEEGDRQAALLRFKNRSDEFAGDILGEIRQIGEGEDSRFGIYLNSSRVGDMPAEHNAFLCKRIKQLETFNKIRLTGGDLDDSGRPFGLDLSLRFPRNTYNAPEIPSGGRMLTAEKGGLFS